MQDGLEPLALVCVGEHVGAHARAIERSVGRDERRPEGLADRVDGDALRRGQAMRCEIGVDDDDASVGKAIGDRGLAAADAACQADGVAAVPAAFHSAVHAAVHAVVHAIVGSIHSIT